MDDVHWSDPASVELLLHLFQLVDEAPVQSVDLHEGLDSTLTILRSKLQGIKVKREYNDGLPHIQAYGSELNQVWTNILDNAQTP